MTEARALKLCTQGDYINLAKGMTNNNDNNIDICIAPYGRNFRGVVLLM